MPWIVLWHLYISFKSRFTLQWLWCRSSLQLQRAVVNYPWCCGCHGTFIMANKIQLSRELCNNNLKDYWICTAWFTSNGKYYNVVYNTSPQWQLLSGTYGDFFPANWHPRQHTTWHDRSWGQLPHRDRRVHVSAHPAGSGPELAVARMTLD